MYTTFAEGECGFSPSTARNEVSTERSVYIQLGEGIVRIQQQFFKNNFMYSVDSCTGKTCPAQNLSWKKNVFSSGTDRKISFEQVVFLIK
jgi:hypothetical protein